MDVLMLGSKRWSMSLWLVPDAPLRQRGDDTRPPERTRLVSSPRRVSRPVTTKSSHGKKLKMESG